MKIVQKRTVHATVGDEFVLSDESKDRVGDKIDPQGWQLKNFLNNPVALFNHNQDAPIGTWENIRVEGGKLIAKLALAAKGTSHRIDEIRSLVEQGILKAVSVGFKPLEAEPIKGGGLHFKRQELLEASIVSIPALPSALALAKSLDISQETLAEVFGENAVETERSVTGKPATPKPHPLDKAIDSMWRLARSPIKKGSGMSDSITLAQRIENAQAELVRNKDMLTENVAADDADQDTIDELTRLCEEGEEKVARLKRAEQALVARDLSPVVPISAPAINRMPLGTKGKEVSPLDLFWRRAVCHTVAHVTNKDIDQVLERMYPDRNEATDVVVKAAVAGATTTAAGWAAELVNTSNTAFLETLRNRSIYPGLSDRGFRMTFDNNNGAIRIPSRAATPSISGSFVGEGAPIPVRRLGLTSITLSPKKMGVISVFSREIARYGAPAIEPLLRTEITNDTAKTIDSLLLDAVAGSAVRPAGLLNGVVAIGATAGGGHAAIIGDVNALIAPFEAVDAGRNVVLVMHPSKARTLRWTPGPDGTFGWVDAILGDLTILTSTNVPTTRIIAIDAEDFASATGDVPEFELSEETVLHLEDTTPLQIATGAQGAGVLATPTQSMFQTAQTAIRMLMDITWAMRRTGMVQFIDNPTW